MFGLSGRQIFLGLFFLFALFVMAQYLPPYYAAFQFNDFIRQEVKFAITARKTPTDVKARIVNKAAELEIPIDPGDITITRQGPSFKLELDYSFPIDLKFHQHDLIFSVTESGEVYEGSRRSR